MAAPVDAARAATNISTAGTSHAINVNSPSAGDVLVVFVRFAAAPGTVTFTGYTPLITAYTDDAADDTTLIFWRVANGSEGATDTLSTTNSVKLGAICWRITGASTVRPPVVSAAAAFTTSANSADPDVAAPVEGSRDYLFLTMAGEDGETGAFTGAPTNYVNLQAANSGTGGAAASNVLMGGASRQLTGASDDPGAFTHAAASNGGVAYTVAVHPSAAFTWTGSVVWPPTLTLVTQGTIVAARRAKVSWAAFETPAVTTPSGQSVLPLTATLVTHGFATKRGESVMALTATEVTQGFATKASAVVLPLAVTEVTQAFTTRKGEVQQALTAGFTTQGTRTVFGASATALTASFTTVGKIDAHGTSVLPLTATFVTQATGQLSGQVVQPLTASFTTNGVRVVYGRVGFPVCSDGTICSDGLCCGTPYVLEIVTGGSEAAEPPHVVLPLVASFTTNSGRETFGQSSLSLTAQFVTDGTVTGQLAGSVVVPLTVAFVTAGEKTTFGQIVLPFTVTETTSGTREVFGASASTYTATITTQGQIARRAKVSWAALEIPEAVAVAGQVVLPLTASFVTQGTVEGVTSGQVVLPLTLTATTSGSRTVFGASSMALRLDVRTGEARIAASPLVFLFGDAEPTFNTVTGASSSSLTVAMTTVGTRTTSGQVVLPLTASFTTQGTQAGMVFGASASSYTVSITTTGTLTAMGASASTYTLGVTTVGKVGSFGSVVLPLTASFVTSGSQAGQVYGASASTYTLTATTTGQVGAFGASTSSYTAALTTQGFATRAGTSTSAYTAGFTTQAKVGAFGSVVLPLTLDISTQGAQAGQVYGVSLSTLALDTVTVGQVGAFSRSTLPLTIDFHTMVRATETGSSTWHIHCDFTTGHRIYPSGSNGHIAFGRWGTPRRTGGGRIARPKIGSLA